MSLSGNYLLYGGNVETVQEEAAESEVQEGETIDEDQSEQEVKEAETQSKTH